MHVKVRVQCMSKPHRTPSHRLFLSRHALIDAERVYVSLYTTRYSYATDAFTCHDTQPCASEPRDDANDHCASATNAYIVNGRARSATTHASDMFQIFHIERSAAISNTNNKII